MIELLASSNLPSYSELGLDWLPDGGSLDLQTMELGEVFSIFLQYAFVIAGFVLFGLIIVSGFKLLTSAGNDEKMARAKKALTNALIGFLIVISSYWIAQIAEIIFGLDITSGTPGTWVQPTLAPTTAPIPTTAPTPTLGTAEEYCLSKPFCGCAPETSDCGGEEYQFDDYVCNVGERCCCGSTPI